MTDQHLPIGQEAEFVGVNRRPRLASRHGCHEDADHNGQQCPETPPCVRRAPLAGSEWVQSIVYTPKELTHTLTLVVGQVELLLFAWFLGKTEHALANDVALHLCRPTPDGG